MKKIKKKQPKHHKKEKSETMHSMANPYISTAEIDDT